MNLRFDVSVEDTIAMHVVDGLEDLVDVELDPLLGQVVPPPFDRLVHVHVHQLKHQCQPPRRLITINRIRGKRGTRGLLKD